jgi:hypothetical protein
MQNPCHLRLGFVKFINRVTYALFAVMNKKVAQKKGKKWGKNGTLILLLL